MSEPSAEERFRHALQTTVADVMPHLAQSLERAFDEVMAGRAVQDDGLPRLRAAIMEGTDNDTGDVWLHREDADILRRIVRAAPPLHDPQEPEPRF